MQFPSDTNYNYILLEIDLLCSCNLINLSSEKDKTIVRARKASLNSSPTQNAIELFSSFTYSRSPHLHSQVKDYGILECLPATIK